MVHQAPDATSGEAAALDPHELGPAPQRRKQFRLGAGQVIAGWDQGVAGMKIGGRRSITIPSHLGYGDRGAGGVIKGGETLVFVVDLLNVG